MFGQTATMNYKLSTINYEKLYLCIVINQKRETRNNNIKYPMIND